MAQSDNFYWGIIILIFFFGLGYSYLLISKTQQKTIRAFKSHETAILQNQEALRNHKSMLEALVKILEHKGKK